MITRRAAPLREQAVIALRQAIVEGSFVPGQRLTERQLCERFEVSRTVIREALRQLESEQLVIVEPQRGPVVAALTLQDVRDLYEVRASLEGAAAKLAARHADAENIAALAELYDEIALSDDLPLGELLALKDDFYRLLVKTAGNRVIGQMLENIQARISQLRRLTLGSPDRHRAMVAELGKVMEAISAGDPDTAYAAAVIHVKSAETIAVRAIKHQLGE